MKAKELRELLREANDEANVVIKKDTRNPFRKVFGITSIRKTEALSFDNKNKKSCVTIVCK